MSSRAANPIVNNLLFKKDGTIETTGSLAFFEAGTSTPLAVYSDEELTTSLGSVLDTDANGLIPDFHMSAGTKYKMVAYDAPAAGGAELWTRDDVFPIDSSVDSRLDSLESTVAGLSVARNACINGGMRVNLGSVHTLDATFTQGTVSELYGRVTNVTGGTLTQGASIAYESGKYAHFSSVTTSTSGVVEAQIRIPSNEAARFVDKAGVFSCLVYQDTGGAITYTVTVKKPTTTDDFSSLSTVSTSGGDSVSSATDTRLSFAVSDLGDVSKGIAIEISAAVGTIASRNFRITEAQLEIGGTRSNFVETSYEVALSALTPEPLPKYFIDFTIANDASDTEHDIEISAGSCRDSANTFNIELSSVLTKQIDANWAAGDDVGGFPSGLALTSNTWYRVFVISKPDGTTDAGFDTSSAASHLLSDATGYVFYRRVGWVLTDGSSNIVNFIQDGGYIFWDVIQSSSTSISTTAANKVISAPPNTIAKVGLSWARDSGADGTTQYIRLVSTDLTDAAPARANSNIILYEGGNGIRHEKVCVKLNASSQASLRGSESLSDIVINSLSWIDDRRSA